MEKPLCTRREKKLCLFLFQVKKKKSIFLSLSLYNNTKEFWERTAILHSTVLRLFNKKTQSVPDNFIHSITITGKQVTLFDNPFVNKGPFD